MDIQPTIDNQQMLPKGTLLHGTYRIERYLASGGFGNTYVAMHLKLKRKFAVKEFFLKNINERSDDSLTVTVSKSNTALYEQQRSKFEKEAQRIYDLSQEAANPHIVHVTDLFDENNTVYYVMDYIDGQSLSVRMKQQGRPFTEQEVVPFIEALADALQTVHALSLQHLDIKPGNIMQDRQGHIFLIDFGASKQIGGDGFNTTTTSMCYTKGYAPFEQVDQLIKSIGPWTDIYAVGATVYNLLTQQSPPLPTEINQEGDEAFSFPPSVSERMRRFILSCMQPKSKLRPQSVSEMLELLKKESQNPEAPAQEVTVLEVENPKPFAKPQPSAPTPVKPIPAQEVTVLEEENPNQTVPVPPKKLNPLETFTVNGVSFNMHKVEGGTFWMGAQKTNPSGRNYDPEAKEWEGPVHEETVSTFYIGKTEVTQELWQAVMGSNPSKFKSSPNPAQKLWQAVIGSNQSLRKPVESVSWDDCQSFIKTLNALTGRHFRLPTEAEWEYAARGGNQSKGYKYAGSNSIDDVAWYDGNSGFFSTTHPVNQKSPNELGLYDMSGNVEEWTSSYWRSNYNASEIRPSRVLRGGCWYYDAWYARVSSRGRHYPDSSNYFIGLRLVLAPQ